MNFSILLGAVSALVVLGGSAQATGPESIPGQQAAGKMAVDGSSEVDITATANSFGTVVRIWPRR